MNSFYNRGLAARIVRPLPHFTAFCIAVVFLLAMVGPVSASLPSISSISPTSGTSLGGTTVTVNGNHFTDNATAGNTVSAVNFGTTPGTGLHVISNTKLTIVSPAQSAGTVDIRVITTGHGISSTTYFDRFTYWVSPTVLSAATNTAGTTITITFSHDMNTPSSQQSYFKYQINGGADKSISAVSRRSSPHHNQFNLTPSGTAIACGDTITISYTPGSVTDDDGHPLAAFSGQAVTNNMPACPSTYTVTYSPNGGSGAVPTDGNTYATGAPVTLKINGTLYRNGYAFNGWNLTSTTGLPYAAGSTYTMGTGNAVFYANWSLSLIPPVVNSIVTSNPTTGCMLGGNTVTITGTGFAGADYVMFGSTPNATGTMMVDSDTQITVTSPSGSGTVDVTVHTPSGTSALNPPADQFTYILAPAVTSVTPPNGPLGGGNTVVIAGTNFTAATSVKFGGIDVSTFVVDNDHQITTSSPPGSGTVDVTVITCSGTSTTSSADLFTYFPDTLTPVMGDWTGTGPNTVGLYEKDNGAFFLRNTNTYGDADNVFQYGWIDYSGDLVPMVGNWTGSSSIDTVGLYQKSTGTFFLKNSNGPGDADTLLQFGWGGDDLVPLKGDWTGSGKDTIGLYQKSTGTFFLKNSNSAGPADNVFQFGIISSGDMVPIIGDWTGKGFDSVGLYQKSTGMFFLKNDNSAGPADNVFNYGPAVSGDIVPVAGDWTHSGIDTIGIYQHSTAFFFLKNTNIYGDADIAFPYGWVTTY